MNDVLNIYQKRLTNLTARNRSLVLLNLPQEQFLDWQELSFLNEKPAFWLIEQLITQKTTFPILPILDPRHEKVNEYSKRLKRISQTEKMISEERGAKELYIGFPFVQGKFADGTPLRCPLLFWAVSLQQENGQWVLQRRDEGLFLNPSFLLAYSHFNQIRFDEGIFDTNFDDFSKESLLFLTQLYEWLKASPLSLNFNSELFSQQLHFFPRLSKSDLENEKSGEIKCYPQAVLGIFPQAGSFLYQDYEVLLGTEAQRHKGNETSGHQGIKEDAESGERAAFQNEENTADFIPQPSHLTSHTLESLFLKPLVPHKRQPILTPLRIDASQENALEMARAGKSLVVQGPPGTGKSQFIANLIADFTARQKKVLLVCQKRVALDTVYKRLSQVGIQAFLALVHDFKNDRKALFEQLSTQIEQVEVYQKQNQQLDAIVIERNFLQAARRIEQISKELDSLKTALFDSSICGLSPKEIYLNTPKINENVDLQDVFKLFRFDSVANFEQRLQSFFRYENTLNQQPNYDFWRERHLLDKKMFRDVAEIQQQIQDIKPFFENKTFEEHLQILEEIPALEALALALEDEQIAFFFQDFQEKKIRIKAKQWDKWLKIARANQVNLNLDGIGLDTAIALVQEARQTSKRFFRWQLWRLSAKAHLLNKILITNDLNNKNLEELSDLLEKQQRFVSLRDEIKLQYDGIKDKDDLVGILQKCKEAGELTNSSLLTSPDRGGTVPSLLGRIKKGLSFQSKLNLWRKTLTDRQIQQIFEEKNNGVAFLNQYFEDMVEADNVWSSFNQAEASIIIQLQQITNKGQELAVFQSALRWTWLGYLEEQNPILRAVSSQKIEQLTEELQHCIIKKQELSQEIFQIRLKEQSYQHLEKNRLGNVTTYRSLYHQTTKKRKIWSIRKILEHHFEEIFSLVPCWLASPESVSALFPMQQDCFDLVIFDEASQCFVENAIPAIFRGKQVVIAGDSQQLQPSDLYQIRYEESNDDPLTEIDSLLNIATQFLPQTMLREHYRSQNVALIAFSNQHFYKNRLQFLPHFNTIREKNPAISYELISGIWKDNSNIAESENVQQLVEQILKKTPQKSIGIVTFNHKQARLIADKLPESLQITVKNIENIQGDEFDIVIFSIAYAPDIKGKMTMQFGVLNQQGGENRLNVAISRAKEKIIVVSSILPEQLHVAMSQNTGPKLLKAYLEYAWAVSEGEDSNQLTINKLSPKTQNKQTHVYLKDHLCQQNPNYVQHLPFADITVKKSGEYQSLILTDDDLYYEQTSAQETFAYLPLTLQEKGWNFERKWSRNREPY